MNRIAISKNDIANIQNIINYSFKKKHILLKSFTHSSYCQENNYEQYEFLGDSILSFLSSEWLFKNKNNYKVGKLSKIKSQIINNVLLSEIIYHLKLEKYILVGNKVKINAKISSDVYESLIAAIYIDSGIKKCKDFLILH